MKRTIRIEIAKRELLAVGDGTIVVRRFCPACGGEVDRAEMSEASLRRIVAQRNPDLPPPHVTESSGGRLIVCLQSLFE